MVWSSFGSWFKPSPRKTEPMQWVEGTFVLEPILTPSGIVDAEDGSDDIELPPPPSGDDGDSGSPPDMEDGDTETDTGDNDGGSDSSDPDSVDISENTADDIDDGDISDDISFVNEDNTDTETDGDREDSSDAIALEENQVEKTIAANPEGEDDTSEDAGDVDSTDNQEVEDSTQEDTGDSNDNTAETENDGTEDSTEETENQSTDDSSEDAVDTDESEESTGDANDSADDSSENTVEPDNVEESDDLSEEPTGENSEETEETSTDGGSQDAVDADKSEASTSDADDLTDDGQVTTLTNDDSTDDSESEEDGEEIVDEEENDDSEEEEEDDETTDKFELPNFDSGVWTVGANGKVDIDFLHDGGAYQGDLGIFSLKGLEELTFETIEDFIAETAARVNSNSKLGYVAISDSTEGARFDGSAGEGKNWNSGEYRGVKTFEFEAGDRVGFMLVPNGSIGKVVDNPSIEGASRPLYSMSTANPDDEFHFGQVADVTGDGSTFVIEDVRADQNSDKDYNDIIFQVRGATGNAVHVSEVIKEGKNWQDSDVGQAISAYSEPYVTPDPADTPDTTDTSGDGEIDTENGDDVTEDNSDTEVTDTDNGGQTYNNSGANVGEINFPDESTNNADLGEKTGSGDTAIDSENTDNSTDSVNKDIEDLDLVDGLEEESEEIADATTEEVEAGAIAEGEGTTDSTNETDRGETSVTETAVEDSPSERETYTFSLPKFEFPEADQPEVIVIDEVGDSGEATGTDVSDPADINEEAISEIVEETNSKAQLKVETASDDNWAEVLVQTVDRVRESARPNAVVSLNLDLTELDLDGNVVSRELTPIERAAIAYARDREILLVVPSGDTASEMSALGELSEEFDNVITVGAAERVNDATSAWKAYEPAENSGTGETLDLVADGSYEGTVSTAIASTKVTAAISQVWAANPELNYTQVIDILQRTATDLDRPNWDSSTGSGLLNLAAAVHLAKATEPKPYTVKPGTATITDNFISSNPAGKSLPGDPTHPAVEPPGIPQTNIDTGANDLGAATQLLPSATQDVMDQVSAIDPTDIFKVDRRYIEGAELAVLSGELSVSYLTPSGQVLGTQVLTRGSHHLQPPANAPEEVIVKIDRRGQNPATYTLYGFETTASEPFDINLEFDSSFTASQQQIARAAAKSVAGLIGKGLPTAIVDGKIIDDLNIKLSAANVDGAGGTQARTKIDFMRYGSLLPAQSLVQFDAVDLAQLEQSGQLFNVVQHEFLHALGFGNLWEAKGLVDYPNTSLARYNGKKAVSAFQEAGGLTETIALENEGDGSAGLHWNENLFGDELMSPDLNLGSATGDEAPISEVTIASLADLGYEVNLGAATAGYELNGGITSFDAESLSEEDIEALREFFETSYQDEDAQYIAPIMPEVNPDKVAPEIWAHAERFWKNGEYYDWVPYQIRWGDTLSQIALDTMGSFHEDYYWWIANHNGIPNPDYIVTGNWIDIPVHRPNYEWEQEQERKRREQELQERQEREAREAREREERLARDKAEQERKAREEEERRKEAERKQRELEEQERRLREEQERRRQEEERRKEEERLRELERQREIARQKGKGGQDWFFATPLPEFGPVDPFETKLTGETVGNLVPDDYYRFTLSRKGRIDARLMNLLADADLVLYDVRNRPISYSMREGITDEQILVDLIPGTYLLRVNSPKGVTTDYDLIVKFKHLLSRTEQGPPPGWRVGGGNNGGGGASGPVFSDPRIKRIYDTALANFAEPERAKADTVIADLEREKRSYEQQMQELLDKMNAQQRAKVHRTLDDARHNAFNWVDNIANPIKGSVDSLADGIINEANSFANNLENFVNGISDFGIGWIKDRKNDAKRLINQGRDAVKGAVNSARSWLKGKLAAIQDGVKSAIWHFFETIKNGYHTGAEINQIIANAAQTFRSAVDGAVRGASNLIGQFKGKVLSAVDWTKNLGINVDRFGVKFNFNVYDKIVKPAVNGVADGFQSVIGGIGNSLKGIVDWMEPRTQKVVADVVNAILGDETGHLWNKINGVDAKIAATRTGLENAIASMGQYILGVARKIENFLGDPEERNRVLKALWEWGFTTIDEAYQFIVKKRDEVRKKIEAEKEARRKAEEEALLKDTLQLSSQEEEFLKKVILGSNLQLIADYEFLKNVSQASLVDLHTFSGVSLPTDVDPLSKKFLNKRGKFFEKFSYLDLLQGKLAMMSLARAHKAYERLSNAVNGYSFGDLQLEKMVSSNTLKMAEDNYANLERITQKYQDLYSFNVGDALLDAANGLIRSVGSGLHLSKILIEWKTLPGKSLVKSAYKSIDHGSSVGLDVDQKFKVGKAVYDAIPDIHSTVNALLEGDFNKVSENILHIATLAQEIETLSKSAGVGNIVVASEFIKLMDNVTVFQKISSLLSNLKQVQDKYINSDDVDFVYWSKIYSSVSTIVSVVDFLSALVSHLANGLNATQNANLKVDKMMGYLDAASSIVDSGKGAMWALFEEINSTEIRTQNALYSYGVEYHHSVIKTAQKIVNYVAHIANLRQ